MLRKSQLVEEQILDDDARVRVYRLRREPFDQLESWLEDVQALWGGQLASFKAYAALAPPVAGVQRAEVNANEPPMPFRRRSN